MTMDCQLQPTDVSTSDVGMDFGRHPDVYSKLIGNSQYVMNAAKVGMQCIPSGIDGKVSFADAVSPLTHLEPFTPDYGTLGDTTDPTTLWPASMDNPNMPSQQPPMQASTQTCDRLPTKRTPLSSSPLTTAQKPSAAEPQRSSSTPTSINAYGRPPYAQASTHGSMISDSAVSASPAESEKTRRARYAANQRHSKAQKARKDSQQNESTSEADTRAAERKQRHREKNKVAAAKCRSRQRKQVQNIQEKGSRLGEKNAELKTIIQELRGDLNGLRSMALDHQQCNCRVARYNHGRTERVVAEYRSSCLGQGFGGFGHVPEWQGFQAQ